MSAVGHEGVAKLAGQAVQTIFPVVSTRARGAVKAVISGRTRERARSSSATEAAKPAKSAVASASRHAELAAIAAVATDEGPSINIDGRRKDERGDVKGDAASTTVTAIPAISSIAPSAAAPTVSSAAAEAAIDSTRAAVASVSTVSAIAAGPPVATALAISAYSTVPADERAAVDGGVRIEDQSDSARRRGPAILTPAASAARAVEGDRGGISVLSGGAVVSAEKAG